MRAFLRLHRNPFTLSVIALQSLCVVLVLGIAAPGAADVQAQEVQTCQTANGPRTTAELTAELQRAGYAGPWDTSSQAAAYAQASGGPVTCGSAQSTSGQPVIVMFVAGYGSDLSTASVVFTAVQDALLERDPNVSFVQFSYTGSNIQNCDTTPAPYGAADTAQDISISKRVLLDTLQALQAACPNARIAVLGHSLGGLIAFQALSDQPLSSVVDVTTVDSPLGGAPASELNVCVTAGFCAQGPISDNLVQLYTNWSRTSADNTARQAKLQAAQTQVEVWGNHSDCVYNAGLCSTLATGLVGSLGGVDATETQWLGVSNAVRKDYAFAPRVWNILASHTAVLENSADDLATDLLRYSA